MGESGMPNDGNQNGVTFETLHAWCTRCYAFVFLSTVARHNNPCLWLDPCEEGKMVERPDCRLNSASN